MVHFWESNTWGFINLLAVVFASLIVASLLKKILPFLRKSLIPTSVLGGLILLIIATIYFYATGDVMFDTEFFGENGSQVLEILTFHMLALGFIASTLVTNENKMTKQRATEVFDTGLTTVSTYLLQGLLGLGITIVMALFITDLFPAAGVILPFGYGQGTG